MNYDVIVIGGGVAGASCAYHLVDAGVENVLLLEADQPASKASGRAGGFLTPDQFLATGSHDDAHRYIRTFWERISDRPGLALHYGDAYTFARVPSSVDRLERLHAETAVDSELLAGPEVDTRIPNLVTADIEAAFTFADGMYCDPHLATTTLFDAAIERGVEARLERVTAIEPDDDAVVTEAGSYESSAVVIAAGAWSKQVAATAGVDIPLKPRISQIAMLRADISTPLPLINDPDLGLYYRSEIDGDVLIGGGTGTEELDLTDFSTQAEESFLQEVAEKAPAITPELEDGRLSSSWAGRCSATPDRHPLVGEAGIEGVYLCCGFNGEGLMYSAPAGRLIADLLLDRQSPFDPDPYDPGRFGDEAVDFEIKSAIDW